MSKSSNACACEACVGSTCSCGCQDLAGPSSASCRCGDDCRGGATCDCGACDCGAPANAAPAGYR